MSESGAWQTVVHGLLQHPADGRLLVHPTPDGDVLPAFTLDENALWAGADVIRAGLAQAVGGPVNLLYRARYEGDEAKRRAWAVYVVEARDAIAGHWRAPGDARFAAPAHAAVVDEVLAEQAGPPPPWRQAWSRPGWYAVAEQWIDATCRRLDLGAAAVTPVRTWALSCVLRGDCTRGATVFFKAGPDLPLFVNEAAVTAGLAESFSSFAPTIPRPLAVDADRRWLLLPHLEGVGGWTAPLADRRRTLARYGALQRASADRLEELLALGCLDRRPLRLAEQLERLYGDLPGDYAPGELADIRARIPDFQARCAAVAEGPLAAALVHGDLHMANVALTADGPAVFDWSDACVAHPFVDLLMVFVEKEASARSRLLDAYLAAWADRASLAELRTRWRLARPVAALHHVISYLDILAHVSLDSYHELAWGVSSWLRRAHDALLDPNGD